MSGNLNPRIRDVDVGIREIRTVTVYPVAYGKKIKSRAFVAFAEMLDGFTTDQIRNEISLSKAILSVVKDHLSELIELATGEQNLLDDVDATQMVEIIEVLYEQNFKPYEKKIMQIIESLSEKEQLMKSTSKKRSASSSNGMDLTSVMSTLDQLGKEG